jgi:hypothetical protein
MSDYDVYVTAESFGNSLKVVETYRIASGLDAGDMALAECPHQSRQLRLCHSVALDASAVCPLCLLSELSNALTYPRSFLFVLDHSFLLVKTDIYQRRTA